MKVKSQDILPLNKRLTEQQKLDLTRFRSARFDSFMNVNKDELLLKYHEALMVAEAELKEFKQSLHNEPI